MGQAPELLTVREAAEVFRVTEETVRSWVRQGRLKSVPMPTRIVRFRRVDVEAMLTDQPADAVTA